MRARKESQTDKVDTEPAGTANEEEKGVAPDDSADAKTQEGSENVATQEGSEKSGDNKEAAAHDGSEPVWVKCWDNLSQVNFVIDFFTLRVKICRGNASLVQ